jgi:hypothetical protein
VEECITIKQTDAKGPESGSSMQEVGNITTLAIFLEGRPTMLDEKRHINGHHLM